jgi:tRNA-2-methylthio-N6-dimethylallyladenosine synthase
MPSVYIKTYGCQMNERDSEAVAAQLIAKGYALAPSEALADVILLNTCSVRDAAEQKALGKMRALAGGLRRSRRPVLLGFMGCMAQARGQMLIDQLPDVDLVLGTQKFHRAPDYISELLAGRAQRICDITEESGSESAIRTHLLAGKDRARAATAFVSIMQGCNQHCTFCIVPSTRGAERSRSIEEIVAEGRELVSQGVKEVTLLGQIVTSYGKRRIPERDGKTPFVQLLEAVSEIDGLERVRFTSPHPKGYGDDLIEAYGRLPKLCENAHVPVQSGSDRVLKLMHRGYSAERFLTIVEKLRRVQPGMGVTTDFIVGFPGETDADFEQTLAFVREVEFDNAYAFKYSPRSDTPAAAMPDQVPQPVKEERHAALLDLVTGIGQRRYQAFVGKQVEVLVEGVSRKNAARLEGRTRCNKIVVFEGPAHLRGQLVQSSIERASTFTLYGDPRSTSAVAAPSASQHAPTH